MPIDVKPGEKIKRTELHERYGGRRQGGISPSKQTPNVFLFTDQTQGAIHGYIYDGQSDKDGLYHYTGEGQTGDQRMVQGNRAVRDHATEERELHLFDSSGGIATYLGQFKYVDDYEGDAHQTNEPELRKVIVFKLRRISGDAPLAPSRLNQFDNSETKVIPIEQHLTERTLIEPNREPYEAERREQPLVLAYAAFLRAQGHEVDRLYLRPKDEAPLLCDLFDQTTNTLIEAKGTVSRAAFRMAIGQLADYARLVEPAPQRVILLPERPRADLLSLATGEDIGVTWQIRDGEFGSTDPVARGSGG